ncbi:MAG: glycine hydroxymethyltransferase [Chlamydiia bacterium]|nr:glycine hydroxymethyltransferase [Chlamydiia bacterium]
MSRVKKYLESRPFESLDTAALSVLSALEHLELVAPEVAAPILAELKDQRENLKLIASENFSSLSVQLAMGNWMTDKYAEGTPFHRFYAGCSNVDQIEKLAEDRLIELFGSDAAYVQPHSGADANLVAFWSILTHRIQTPEVERLGKKTLEELTEDEYETIRKLICSQKIMGLSLRSGGHLTHGYRHNLSGKMMQSVQYDVDPKTHLLDLEKVREQVKKEKPLILLIGYSAYSRKINFAEMKAIADEVGATLMVDMAHFSGLVAGKVFTDDFNPVPFADILTSTTHKTLRGPRGGFVLCKKAFQETVAKGCPLALGGPLPHVLAAKAIAFKEALAPEFKTYAHQVVQNAQVLAETLKKKDIPIITGGTDNHLLVMDVSRFGINGRHAENALRLAGLTCNRNAIPEDKNGAWYTSGIRLGTPASTTLGMKEAEMKEIGGIIETVLKNTKPDTVAKTGEVSKVNVLVEEKALAIAKAKVKDLLGRFPLYPEITLD